MLPAEQTAINVLSSEIVDIRTQHLQIRENEQSVFLCDCPRPYHGRRLFLVLVKVATYAAVAAFAVALFQRVGMELRRLAGDHDPTPKNAIEYGLHACVGGIVLLFLAGVALCIATTGIASWDLARRCHSHCQDEGSQHE